MRIQIFTKVEGNYKTVYQKFNQNLFVALQPKFPKLKLLRFDGSRKGDIVHIQFVFPKMDWISEITEDKVEDSYAKFIDVGKKLPFGLCSWEHQHIIHKVDDHNCVIEDAIKFTSWNKIFTALCYPLLYFSFLQRKPIYKSYFKQNDELN